MIALLTLAGAASLRADTEGSICIAPLPANVRAIDHDRGGRPPRQYSYEFAVQIGDASRIRIPEAAPQLETGFALGKRHRVRIYDGERIIESFNFTFEKRGSERLCLSYIPWYQTWSLEKPGMQPWCKCPKPGE